MREIISHPVLNIGTGEEVSFMYKGVSVAARKGYTIAAALHRAGYPVHSHSLGNRKRSLECGIGKCGACEMLVDGQIKRICITPADGVKEVAEIPDNFQPFPAGTRNTGATRVYYTRVAIIGAGPAGLAAREELNRHGIDNIVVDSNGKTGGQFLMQTHQFFFFEKEKKYGGMRGFDIASTLAGRDTTGIFLNSTVWDIFGDRRLAVKNLLTGEIFYIMADHLIVATGAVPFMPPFENDDLPGVYTAAVVQKMMNQEFTLLGKNILTVGAGNIGYLTSYQLMQAGARVKAIIEAQPFAGGFPVQANRVTRLGIPLLTSRILVKAIPNRRGDGITGAVVAESENFRPVPGTERILEGIDAINICTGLVADDLLLTKGREVFGRQCHGAGDAIRIGEGTSAVLRGRQVAMEIMEEMGESCDYDSYLALSKEYIDSQQHPVKVREEAIMPGGERRNEKPFVLIDCLYGFACNPCEFACPHRAITKTSTSAVPVIDYDKCTGCMACIYQCPGLAIFGYNLKKDWLFLPVEFSLPEKTEVFLVNNDGKKLGTGVVEKILTRPNRTNVARVKSKDLYGEHLAAVRGFIPVDSYPESLVWNEAEENTPSETFLCHCDDVRLDDILKVIGDRKYVTVDEIKHTTRLGMGACRGKRCIKRLRQAIKPYGITVVGEATPRGPMSNQVSLGDLQPAGNKDRVMVATGKKMPEVIEVRSLVAGGGIGGSALFRYLAEAGLEPLMINYGHGASWRNIAGGRPAFSVPELSDIARQNLRLFEELQSARNIDFRKIRYVNFAHDDQTMESLEASMAWQDAYMISPPEFAKEISPAFNDKQETYQAALITRDCWQATPGKTVDLLRNIGTVFGGRIIENAQLVDLRKDGEHFIALVRNQDHSYTEYHTGVFINALGPSAAEFASQAGYETGQYAVRHQAFITRRLPFMGCNGDPLPMLIDRRKYKGFVAVYGQQLAETGQVIGCASPAVDERETGQNLKINSRDFAEIVAEVFTGWLPALSSAGFQAVWSGYYVEPRMIIDPAKGLFTGLRGQGFMLGQYLAKLYVDDLLGRRVPDYFHRLKLEGDGLLETALK